MFRKGLGDALAGWHDPVFKGLAAAAPADATLAVFTFGLQIYLDFSGYSEMAVGLARMLGVDLMQNFNAPYLSVSPRDFWRRWHISLSQWLRDYLYISLGGSRVRLPVQVGNLLFTMTVCGLWHGAGWNFILWGLIHGIYLAVNAVFNRFAGAWIEARRWAQVPIVAIGVPLTYLLVNYAWIFFRLPTLADALTAHQKIGAFLQAPASSSAPTGIYAIFLIVLVLDLVTRFRGEIFPFRVELTWVRALAYGAIAGGLLVASLILIVGVPEHQFIYFNF
jgi:D-alanyl-lipoteichoic acid acyltransferase DltB (MBOAT superfamily)